MTAEEKEHYLIDNRDGRTIQKEFERWQDENVDELFIAVGYFHVSGFNLISKYLKNVKKISIIIGTDTDRPTKEQLGRGYREIISHDISAEMNSITEKDETKTLNELYEYIKAERIDIRVYTKTKFHAKTYIFKRKNIRSDMAIIGSSNLSLRGFR